MKKTKRSVYTKANSYVQVKDEVSSRKTTVCLENVAELQHCTNFEHDPDKFLPCMLMLDKIVDRPDKTVDGNFVRPNNECKPAIFVRKGTEVKVLIEGLETTIRKLKQNPKTVLSTNPKAFFGIIFPHKKFAPQGSNKQRLRNMNSFVVYPHGAN